MVERGEPLPWFTTPSFDKEKAVQPLPTLRHPAAVGQGKAVQFGIQDDDVNNGNGDDDDDAPDDYTTADSDDDATDGTVGDPDKDTQKKPPTTINSMKSRTINTSHTTRHCSRYQRVPQQRRFARALRQTTSR